MPLPTDCALSMSIRDVHFDATIFPNPDKFIVSRWLPTDFYPTGKPLSPPFNPTSPSGKLLSRFLVAYARGPRDCLGRHLAQVEVYAALASFFRRFGERLRLDDSVGRESVEIYMDRFAPRPRPGVGTVKVTIDETDDMESH